MGKRNWSGLVLLAALVIGFAGATASPQPASRVAVRASETPRTGATPSQVRVLDGRVSQLTPVRTIVAAPVPRPSATGIVNPNIRLTRPDLRVIPTVPNRRPPANAIQYVRTTRALDREISAALVSQPAIRNAIGSNGSIATLPGILRQTDAAGNAVQLKAFAIAGRPLVYDAAQRVYRGTIILGITAIVPRPEPLPLTAPVVFQVLDADSADPAETSFQSTSPPYKIVQVTLSAVRPVQVLSTLIPDGGVNITLPLNPMLAVEVGRSAIDGFGLETTPVNISLLGVERPGGRVVTLRTDAGYLDPTRVQLDENGNASVAVRSGSVGASRITATTPGVESAQTIVQFNFPYLTLLASIFGGLAGGFVRARGRPRGRALAVAAVWGLIVFVCYAVGINLLPFTPSVTIGAALVFAVSALGALFGPALLRRS
jgi:hypothetical protein